jgi:hypothetical protein
VWEELERRDATAAVVPFYGRAGRGGSTDVIKLLRLEGEELIEVERWTGRDALCYALEAPVWDLRRPSARERAGELVGRGPHRAHRGTAG